MPGVNPREAKNSFISGVLRVHQGENLLDPSPFLRVADEVLHFKGARGQADTELLPALG